MHRASDFKKCRTITFVLTCHQGSTKMKNLPATRWQSARSHGRTLILYLSLPLIQGVLTAGLAVLRWVVRRFISLSIRLWHLNPSAFSAPAQSWVFHSALPHRVFELTHRPMRLHLFVRSAWRESHPIHLACRLGHGGCGHKVR